MDVTEGLALAAFAVLVALLVVVARRMGRLIAATRAEDSFQRAVADLVRRADATLAEVSVRLDDVRYRHAAPHTVGGEVDRAARGIEALTAEARQVAAGIDQVAVRDGLVAELVRAGGALASIGKAIGVAVAGAVDDVERTARPGPVDVSTTVKRGYLAIIHAREAMASLAVRAAGRSTPAATGRRNPEGPGAGAR